MRQDARFEDGAERPLRLLAAAPEDLAVISALIQDAVGETGQIVWLRKRHRFSLLLNRFRWEDMAAAARQGRPYERVQCLLSVEGVLRARTRGLDPCDRDVVISVLALDFEGGADGAGTLRLTLAGDGEIALDVECLDVTLADVARPHLAHAKVPPTHRID